MVIVQLVRRVVALLMAMLASLVVLAPAASAHSVSGAGASNFRTTLTALEPHVPGLELRVIEAGSRLELTNHTGRDVTVKGYTGEPYLRVGPDGVFTNRRSSATYLNATRNGTSKFPPGVDDNAPPVWDKVSTGQVARWHDHRTHWMGGALPPNIRQHPDQRQAAGPPWSVELLQGDAKVVATGTLEWVPPPSSLPWLAVAAVIGIIGALVASRPRAWRVPALLLGALVVVDVVHAAGLADVIAGSLAAKLSRTASANVASIVAWVLAALAFSLLMRRRDPGRQFGVFAAMIILIVGGISDVAYLSKAVLPFGFDASVGRAVVAVTLGLGSGLVLGWLVRLLLPALRPPRPHRGAPTTTGAATTKTAA